MKGKEGIKKLYRKLRHSRGYGVHSPFVYNLITKVIEEKGAYYRFGDIELIRRRLLQNETMVSYPDRRRKGKTRKAPIREIVRREAIRPRQGALLFRLTNHFKPEKILQIGPSMGISTLYLTSYAPGLQIVSIENRKEFSSISEWVYKEAARSSIDLRTGDYAELLPSVLKEMGEVDFIFFNGKNEQEDTLWLFTTCIKYLHEGSVFVCTGIHDNKRMRSFWKEVCAREEVTVTLDLYSMGVAFFNKKLHKRNYKAYY